MRTNHGRLASVVGAVIIFACLFVGAEFRDSPSNGGSAGMSLADLAETGLMLLVTAAAGIGVTWIPISIARQRARDSLATYRRNPGRSEVEAAFYDAFEELPTSEQLRLLQHEYGRRPEILESLQDCESKEEFRAIVERLIRVASAEGTKS